jgi:hypothetical protein
VGWDAKSSRGDLGGVKTEIFFQTGLDCPNHIDPVQQFSSCAQAAQAGKAPQPRSRRQ